MRTLNLALRILGPAPEADEAGTVPYTSLKANTRQAGSTASIRGGDGLDYSAFSDFHLNKD